MLANQDELITRYQRIRQVGLKLNNMLVQRLDKRRLQEGARQLGMLRGDVVVFDSMDMSSVLMDYCLHDVRRHGRTVIEDLLAEGRFPPGSEESVYLEAIVQAKYGIFLVEKIEPAVGVDVLDVLRGKRARIVDVNFSRTAQPGLTLAARICTPGDFTMTTGAALPLGLIPGKKQAEFVRQMERAHGEGLDDLSPADRSAAIAKIIRTALNKGAADQIAYEEPGRRPRTRASLQPADMRVGRNDLCPCGSGKK